MQRVKRQHSPIAHMAESTPFPPVSRIPQYLGIFSAKSHLRINLRSKQPGLMRLAEVSLIRRRHPFRPEMRRKTAETSAKKCAE